MRGLSRWSSRGGNWVAAQITLMALTLVAGALPPGWGGAAVPLRGLGAMFALLGALLVAWAWRALGPAATPFPVPRGRLVATGPYAYVRHPIYTGGVLFFLGFALATSPAALVLVVALAVFWRAKAGFEEELLEERYEDYDEYRARVPGAFVPTRMPSVD
jgi:protein-S-isoprenylcysteine O-methyltransferase Ste14